ncbi:MAG: hypothetical protein M1817_005819 [Caeruleum heppii]|nr:MAG: hypothetical protein M1817_005819 [Caeruleum heppii]
MPLGSHNAADGNQANKGSGGGLKGAMSGLHGAGEVLRGTLNQAVDTIAHNEKGARDNQAITQKGFDEIRGSQAHRQGASGVPPTGQTHPVGTTGGPVTGQTHHVGTSGVGTGGATSTNYGPHSSNMANAADPRVDSDMGKVNKRCH